MPQGLCNSPSTFMRLMMSIFGDENFTSLLYYLDDLMVLAPNEQVALERLEMVFSRLKAHDLRLSPRKCHFLRKSVKFLGHVICADGVKTDPGKIKAITDVQAADLMDSMPQENYGLHATRKRESDSMPQEKGNRTHNLLHC